MSTASEDRRTRILEHLHSMSYANQRQTYGDIYRAYLINIDSGHIEVGLQQLLSLPWWRRELAKLTADDIVAIEAEIPADLVRYGAIIKKRYR